MKHEHVTMGGAIGWIAGSLDATLIWKLLFAAAVAVLARAGGQLLDLAIAKLWGLIWKGFRK